MYTASVESIAIVNFLPMCAVPSFQVNKVNYANGNQLLFEAGSVVNLTWTPADVLPVEEHAAYSIDVVLYGLVRQGNNSDWTEIISLLTNASNIGQASVTIPTLGAYNGGSAYLAIAFQVRFSGLLSISSSKYNLLSVPAGIWSKEAYYSYEGGPTRERCIAWASDVLARQAEQQRIEDLPPCPCNVDQADAPHSGFHKLLNEEFFNHQATVCYYQSTPTKTYVCGPHNTHTPTPSAIVSIIIVLKVSLIITKFLVQKLSTLKPMCKLRKILLVISSHKHSRFSTIGCMCFKKS